MNNKSYDEAMCGSSPAAAATAEATGKAHVVTLETMAQGNAKLFEATEATQLAVRLVKQRDELDELIGVAFNRASRRRVEAAKIFMGEQARGIY